MHLLFELRMIEMYGTGVKMTVVLFTGSLFSYSFANLYI